ncbi:hypothetical protein HMPREF9075_00934 [Capnocytophaga sp. oral taxon 332 str. F0381]|nr:hypothetical protein HMPREF9075_00934 [Capnocytophaga sp. oral taxon 332 str. F0381]
MVGDDGVMLAIGDLSAGHKRACFKNHISKLYFLIEFEESILLIFK